MRRIARGRIVPQSRSTDPRMGRVSLKAATLYDRVWINADDQGRVSGDPDEIKYTACPNLPDISKDDIPGLLLELEKQGLIQVYSTSRQTAIQMLDWWQEQKLQWAYPSPYPPPEGWTDHLRYHPTPKEIITEKWPPSVLPSKLPSELAKPLPSELADELPSKLPSELRTSPLSTPSDKEKEKEEEKEEGKGRSPSVLGSRSPSSPSKDNIEILHRLTSCFKKEWGRVPAESPDEIIPREPNARESAQLRDLATELSAAGCPLDSIDLAFREAAGQTKFHVRYVRAILLDWLGVERIRPQ